MLWENLREEEFKSAVKESNGLCILPIGCVEKHGQHLPLGTDVIWAGELARISAEKEPAVVFPTMYFGEKTGAGEFNGTIIFSAKLRFDILTETCDEIARNGFKKILILNGHGGNGDMIGNFLRSVLYSKKDYMVYSTYINLASCAPDKLLEANYDYLTADDKKILQSYVDEGKFDGHGGFVETSRILGVRPELVRLDKMNQESGLSVERFAEFSKYNVSTPFAWMADYPNSYSGSYHEGLNERIARAQVEYASDKAASVFKFLKNETVSNEYHKEWLAKQ